MKIGFISEATKILIYAASVIITCTLVALGFRASDIAKDISNNATRQIAEIDDDIKDGDIMKYDGNKVNGSEVINFIKRQLGDYFAGETSPIYIYVKTSVSENTYTDKSYFANITDFTDTRYIKPTAVFMGQVIKNENKVIIGVSFVQQ